MSSYNNITKIKYVSKSSDLVKLNEYIMFRDDKAKRQYVVFKFVNNVTQQLLGMEFEVCQYNVDGLLIEKAIVVYNKFLAGAEEEFVPKAKLRVSYKCTTISIRLIKAAYDRFIWKEGEFEDNVYKFDHFFRDEQSVGGSSMKKRKRAQDTEDRQQSKREKKKKKKSKKPFVMRDATRKNFSKLPSIFNVVAMVLVIAFVAGSVFLFKKDGKLFTVDSYMLRQINEQEVAVCGYVGDKTDLTIPEKIGNYSVTKIDGGAFKKSDVATVTIETSLIIEAGAFVKCNSLTLVSSDKALTVKEGAFVGCNSVRLDCSSSIIEDGAIDND